jgi:hypothetical protein
LEGNVWNKITQKRGRPSWTYLEDCLNGKLHLIQAHDGNVTYDCAVCSNREVKGGRAETSFYRDMCPRKPGLHFNKCFAIYHTAKKYCLLCYWYKYLIKLQKKYPIFPGENYILLFFLCKEQYATDTCMFNGPLITHSLHVETSSFTLRSEFHFTVLTSVFNLWRPTAPKGSTPGRLWHQILKPVSLNTIWDV